MRDRMILRSRVLSEISLLGEHCIIGGWARDIAHRGTAAFQSDIDIVIDPDDYYTFHTWASSLGGIKNRFGGYRLGLHAWKIDIWALQDTWAHTAGHVEVKNFEDLLKCTFFDWDAILYSPITRKITCNIDYFEKINSQTLDINLPENPNPRGSAVRALRRLAQWQLSPSERLSEYLLNVIGIYGWVDILHLESAAFSRPILLNFDAAKVVNLLETGMPWRGNTDGIGDASSRQLEIEF
ncbi:MAG: hypothetical protein ACFB13_12860 [Kiloniellaceae bacterium]